MAGGLGEGSAASLTHMRQGAQQHTTPTWAAHLKGYNCFSDLGLRPMQFALLFVGLFSFFPLYFFFYLLLFFSFLFLYFFSFFLSFSFIF